VIQNEEPDAWMAEQLAQLKIDYLIYKEEEEAGTRAKNTEAARDVTQIGDRIFEEVCFRGMVVSVVQ
jgi:hypothetical protein